jgi:flagellar biosynthetic protein FliR
LPHAAELNWSNFLAAMTLALVRISGMVAFAPFFSSTALPVRTKAVFVGAVAYLLAPLVAALPQAQISISFSALLGELAVGLVYGLTLTLLTEMMIFAGQVVGVQFSFSAVNLLDPTSSIQTPLLGDLFQLMGTLVVIASGLDRILLASMVRSFRAVPLGSYALAPTTAVAIVRAAGGIFLAAVELAAPVLAATMLVEVAISLLGKLSPQLPVMSLTVPIKTLTGFGLLIGSLALWPRFIEARFAGLLDLAERLISAPSSPVAMHGLVTHGLAAHDLAARGLTMHGLAMFGLGG